jgi:hypothetical protein
MKRNILLFGCMISCIILLSLSYQPIAAKKLIIETNKDIIENKNYKIRTIFQSIIFDINNTGFITSLLLSILITIYIAGYILMFPLLFMFFKDSPYSAMGFFEALLTTILFCFIWPLFAYTLIP